MEDDVEETPIPFTGSDAEGPLARTAPHFQTSGAILSAVAPFARSLYGAEDVRRFRSVASGSADDSQARFADLIFFPGGDSGFGARSVSPASEATGGEKEQDEGKWRENEEETRRVEVQVGRRLRAIGDLFQREREVRRVVRYRREWEEICWHLATMLFIFLYPREFIGN